MLHESQLKADLHLEKMQVEEEIVSTQKDEKRLKEVIKQFTKDCVSQLNHELEQKDFSPSSVLCNLKTFVKKIGSLRDDYQGVGDNLDRLRSLNDKYLHLHFPQQDEILEDQVIDDQALKERMQKDAVRYQALREMGVQELATEMAKAKKEESDAQGVLAGLECEHEKLQKKHESLRKLALDNAGPDGDMDVYVISYVLERTKMLEDEIEILQSRLDLWNEKLLEARQLIADINHVSATSSPFLYNGEVHVNHEAANLGFSS